MEKVAIYILAMLCLASCSKEDVINPDFIGTGDSSDPFGMRYSQVEMGDDYRFQSFFDLGTNKTVSSNIKSTWDLALSCSEGKVLLNSAKNNMRAAESTNNWESTTTIDGLEFSWDAPTRHDDSLAIGLNLDPVYVIQRGEDYLGNDFGYRKVLITYNEDYYAVKMADLDGQNEVEMQVGLNEDFNFIFLSLDGLIEEIEPLKEDWDLSFSTYLYIFDPDTEPFPYLVNGCVINSNGVTAARVFDKPFSEISADDIDQANFSAFADAVGYDWKYFDFDLGYVTDPSMNYIIQSTEGSYYKLHFTSFVNAEGLKGYPSFEFQMIRE
jgi:hypothetical protein